MSARTPDPLRHRYGVAAAVVAAVILLGSAAVLVWAFTSPAVGAPLVTGGSRGVGAPGPALASPMATHRTRTTNPSSAAGGDQASTGSMPPGSPAAGPASGGSPVAGPASGGGAAGPVGAASGPTATGLDPELLRRFEAAAAAARRAGVPLSLTSGWRSAAEQEQIIQRDITAYGSVTEAHRWVLPPDKSAHVQGEAIDVGPASGAAWLATNGARFGLCRTYANEAWHFEPVIAPGGTCPPPPHADSSWGW